MTQPKMRWSNVNDEDFNKEEKRRELKKGVIHRDITKN